MGNNQIIWRFWALFRTQNKNNYTSFNIIKHLTLAQQQYCVISKRKIITSTFSANSQQRFLFLKKSNTKTKHRYTKKNELNQSHFGVHFGKNGSSSVSTSESSTLLWKSTNGLNDDFRLLNSLGNKISCWANSCLALWRSLVSSGPLVLTITGRLLTLVNCLMYFSLT